MAVREHKRSYEIYLIHHTHSSNGQDSRKYSKLASIPKYRLNLHDSRINETQSEKSIKLSFEQIVALRSVLKQLDSSNAPERIPVEISDVDSEKDSTDRIEILAE